MVLHGDVKDELCAIRIPQDVERFVVRGAVAHERVILFCAFEIVDEQRRVEPHGRIYELSAPVARVVGVHGPRFIAELLEYRWNRGDMGEVELLIRVHAAAHERHGAHG